MTGEKLDPVSREVLEDRYDGIMGSCAGNLDTKFAMDHIDHFQKLIRRTARLSGDSQGDTIVDELMTMTREHVIRRVLELGIAR